MTEKQYGIVGTVILHTIIILILIFSIISLSKPMPSEGGILINFGDVESAFGPAEPALNTQRSEAASAASKPSQPVETEDGMLTQDFEDAPAVKKQAVTKKTETKKTEVKPVAKPVETAKPAAPKEPTVNKKALYSNKSVAGQSTTESGSSEGIYKGSGNMGSPTGSTESDNYTKGLGGNGGIGFNLNNRSPIHLQKPDFNVQKEGKVVVEITVDRNGKVIAARPGAKESTLVDNTLYAAAKKAALESKFDVKSDAPEKQIGTITYHFKLQ
jgi:TonB family protein